MSSSPMPFHERHSEEVEEIISSPPKWLVRWGITLFMALTLLLLLGTWFIKYPDLVTVPFTLTANNAPRNIIVRVEGRLQKLLVHDGQIVDEKQPVAFCESTGDHRQIVLLGNKISQIAESVTRNHWEIVANLSINQFTKLGEIQNDFQDFTQSLTEIKSFLNGGFYLKKQKLLNQDQADLIAMKAIISEQLALQNQDFELGKEEFLVQQKLHNTKVISYLEYKREMAKLLAREMPIKTLSASLIQNQSLQVAKRKELLELENSIREHKNGFVQVLQTLQSSIEVWKQMHILTTPVAGTISFPIPLNEQQHLTAGQELITVEPKGNLFQGLVKIPQLNVGKLRKGQKVLIKLDGFPYQDYGMIEGSLSKLSMTPGKDSIYWGFVKLPGELITLYGNAIQYRNGLKGQAEIITEDKRLAERLFAAVRNGGH